jgi:uncharacterized membrane-anchored protein YitT (DUF2179 family)
MNSAELGRILIIFGVAVVIIGGLLLLAGRVPWLGRLPGDIRIQRGNFTCFVPLATSIILSIVLTIVLNVLIRRR